MKPNEDQTPGIKGQHAYVLEDLAEEGLSTPVPSASRDVRVNAGVAAATAVAGDEPTFAQRLLARQAFNLVRCPFCKGTGMDHTNSRHAHLWGFHCWICAGWGAVREGNMYLRGPVAGHPSR